VVEWLGECDLDATTLLAALPTGRRAAKGAAAVEWLREALADGPRPKAEVEQAAEAAGIASATLRRAYEQLGVRTARNGFGAAMRTRWYLAKEEDQEDQEDQEDEADDTEETPRIRYAVPDAPVVPTSSSFDHPLMVSATEPDEHNWTPSPDTSPQASSRCPVTGGPHEYAQLRTAQGRLLCMECGEPEQPWPRADM
jgi:hypothetical protein